MGIVTRGDSPSSYDETGDAGKQWYSCRNVGSKEIPPYSIVQLRTETGSSFRAQDVENQQVVWLVQQCTEDGAASGNPALFAFTGPYRIAKGGYGRVTWSFPVQVVHDGRSDRLPNGVLCGPLAGKWEVWSSGRGFVCLCHDMAKAVWAGGKHTVWVAPSPVSVESYGRFYMPDGSVAGSAWIDLQSRADGEYVNGVLPDLVCNLNPPQPMSFTSGSDTLRGLVLPFSGRYRFDLSATVYSADLDYPGIYLGFSVSMWRKTTKATVTQNYRALRYHDVERDYEKSLKVAAPENVAVSGYVVAEAGDVLMVQSIASGQMEIEAFNFTVDRVSPMFRNASTDGEFDL